MEPVSTYIFTLDLEPISEIFAEAWEIRLTSSVSKSNVAGVRHLPPQPGSQPTQGKVSGGPQWRCPSNLIRHRKRIAKKNSKIYFLILRSPPKCGLVPNATL